MNRPYVIPIFIPHLGCPHQCVYCNQNTITGVKSHIDLAKIKAEINFFLTRKRHPKRQEVQIAFYGGSFTALQSDLRKSLLDLAYTYVKKGLVDLIRLSTRPDAIDEERLKELKAYGVQIIELGVQSLDDQVLALAKRGHTAKDVYQASRLIKKMGFSLGWQLMPGLPGETKASLQKTIEAVVHWQPDFVRIYPTLVIKGTVLARWWKEGRYKPLSLEKAIEICKDMFICFETAGIKVIRMGLQPTQSLLTPGHILAGPWHPAFGELVKGAIYLEKIKDILRTHFSGSKKICIYVSPAMVSQIVGQKRCNLLALKRLFPDQRIALTPDLMLKKGKIKIKDETKSLIFD